MSLGSTSPTFAKRRSLVVPAGCIQAATPHEGSHTRLCSYVVQTQSHTLEICSNHQFPYTPFPHICSLRVNIGMELGWLEKKRKGSERRKSNPPLCTTPLNFFQDLPTASRGTLLSSWREGTDLDLTEETITTRYSLEIYPVLIARCD